MNYAQEGKGLILSLGHFQGTVAAAFLVLQFAFTNGNYPAAVDTVADLHLLVAA